MWRASYHISPPAPSISRCVGGSDEEKAPASARGGAGAPGTARGSRPCVSTSMTSAMRAASPMTAAKTSARARLQPAAPPLALGRARRSSAARTDAAIAASACDDTLTTTLGYVQRRVALRDITNHV